jgi:16S rRNA (uracil1498-N3)-methyltransferase
VRQIVPLFSDRTVIKSGAEIGNQKRDRWQRIAEESAELSMRNYVPETLAPQDLTTWLKGLIQSPSLKYICVTSPAPHLLSSLQNSNLESISKIVIVTGCEGGWTAREEEQAIAAGFIPVSLGDRVLSAVTAPVVALSIVGAFLDTQ